MGNLDKLKMDDLYEIALAHDIVFADDVTREQLLKLLKDVDDPDDTDVKPPTSAAKELTLDERADDSENDEIIAHYIIHSVEEGSSPVPLTKLTGEFGYTFTDMERLVVSGKVTRLKMNGRNYYTKVVSKEVVDNG